jgi:predicted TIM-barrel fold metal-dependent hydrolase
MKHGCISADSHLEIKPELYTDRIPAQYRDRAPRTIRLQNGSLAVLQEGRPLGWLISDISCGRTYEERRPFDPYPEDDYERMPGTGSPEQRVREQDIDRVDAEVLFPGNVGPGYWRGIKNDDAFKAVVRAYNDWLAEDYCSHQPERLIGVGVIPMTGVDDAVAELEHCAKLGLKSVCLNSFPSARSFPVEEDDKFWRVACDTGMPLSIHVQFGFPARGAAGVATPTFKYPLEPAPDLPSMDLMQRFNKFGFRGSIHVTQLIWAGVFDRFPTLQIYLAEVQLGWIPNWMEQLDDGYLRHGFWAERTVGLKRLPKMPSEYVREHCWWGFLRNPVGVRTARLEMGVDRLLWGSDHPHLDSDWPRSAEIIAENFAGIPQDEKNKMITGNAIKFFNLQFKDG